MSNVFEYENGKKVFRVTTKEMADTPVSPLLCSNFIEEGFGYQVEGMWSEMFFNRSFERIFQITPATYDWFGGRNTIGNDWQNQEWYHSSYDHNRWYACPGQDLPLSMAPDCTYLIPKAAGYSLNLEMVDGVGVHGDTALTIDNFDERPCGLAQNGKLIRKGAEYHFTGYMKNIGDTAVTAEIRFYETTDPMRWFAEPVFAIDLGEIPAEGRWVDETFTLGEYEGYATFSLFITPGKILVDAFSLMPTDTMKGWRRDVIEGMKRINPGVIRYPGGCFASFHDWRWAIGPHNQRIPEPSFFWGDVNYNDVGTDEFLQMCEEIGSEAMLVVNLFHPDKELYLASDDGWGKYLRVSGKDASLEASRRKKGDEPKIDLSKVYYKQPHGFRVKHCIDIEEGIKCAAQWVQYCNGSVDTPMGALRARNGHPEPYHVKYWEMDNEAFRWLNHRDYAKLLVRYSEAMKAEDPTICIGMTSYHSYALMVNEMLEICGNSIDFLADRVCEPDNLAYKLGCVRLWNENHEHKIFYTDTEALQNRDPHPAPFVGAFYRDNGITIREARRTWIYALSLVSNLLMDMRYGGAVRYMCFNNLANTSGQSCIETPKEGAMLPFCGLIYEQMSRTEAAWPVEIEGYHPTSRKEVEMQVAWDKDREKMILILVNRCDEDTRVSLDFSGVGKTFGKASSRLMWAEGGRTQETARSQGNCHVEYDYSAVNSAVPMTFEIPAFSFTEIVLE